MEKTFSFCKNCFLDNVFLLSSALASPVLTPFDETVTGECTVQGETDRRPQCSGSRQRSTAVISVGATQTRPLRTMAPARVTADS